MKVSEVFPNPTPVPDLNDFLQAAHNAGLDQHDCDVQVRFKIFTNDSEDWVEITVEGAAT